MRIIFNAGINILNQKQMTIIEAIQQAENGKLITNNFLKIFNNRFLKYMGEGVFYQYEIQHGKVEFLYTVRTFSMAEVLSIGWEVLEKDYFKRS